LETARAGCGGECFVAESSWVLRYTVSQQTEPRSEQRVAREGLLEVRVSERGRTCIIAAVGDLDRSTAALLEQTLVEAETTDARAIVVDLSELTFMDSTGLQLILRAHARSQADSNRLSLVRGPERVQRVFQMTGTERLLPFKRFRP
jgi:anti-sigma B factor antagonist